MIEASNPAEAEMPSPTAQLRFRLRFPDNTRIGPFPAQTMIDLNSSGDVPEEAFARREPDGAWLPFHTVFRNTLPRKRKSEKKTMRDRRLNDAFTFVDRRRGKGRMLSQIALCASLLLGLLLAVL